ncbi:hypothetical protein [[Haemophilus] ducreyi]|uniref:hypothetical protein n=1 Tax=Haemophilus ducreyi TaxID=730 RepID=UPI0006566068|nr:hypothetical protein [[Haemophilus] ducreyi]AKO45629.1 hypothetical protein RZ66_05200 [[Haemophilus] ducreyi]AKO47015.1 hypothetical protein RZ67_05115 [[Haemophilus] ducreyi]AKO48360.1 hypothetical protein RZ68_05100 [[Haemophilus] ducreyi]AKO49747.1 hypothetical protein RZ69_05140 [[Haemophilus] ducreyi]ANF61355.1 hypothetical protein A6037_00480 [[Haemophilus] ducreyi]
MNSPPTYSKHWRITGELHKQGHDFVVLMDLQGNLRLEPKRFFKHEGRALEGVINGEFISYYTGKGEGLNKNLIFNK